MQPARFNRWSTFGYGLLIIGVIGQLVLAYVVVFLALLSLRAGGIALTTVAIVQIAVLYGSLAAALGWLWVAYVYPSLVWYGRVMWDDPWRR
jgi:hypothetical protein